eukprot:3696886-Rhodomonas_salina.1
MLTPRKAGAVDRWKASAEEASRRAPAMQGSTCVLIRIPCCWFQYQFKPTTLDQRKCTTTMCKRMKGDKEERLCKAIRGDERRGGKHEGRGDGSRVRE